MTYPRCPRCETLREELLETERDLNARIHTLEGLLRDLYETLGPSRFANERQRIEDVLGKAT